MCHILDSVPPFRKRKTGNMIRKPDIVYIIVNILCLALLIADIELKIYFAASIAGYDFYAYPCILMNLAGSLVVCLLIVFRQSHHQKASLSTKIVIDSCSAVVFLLYQFLLFRFSFLPMLAPESLILLGLFIIPAAYNIFKKIQSKTHVK